MENQKFQSAELQANKAANKAKRASLIASIIAGGIALYAGFENVCHRNLYNNRPNPVEFSLQDNAIPSENRGGLKDYIFKHPELRKLQPEEFLPDGTIIKVERYYNGFDFFSDPGEVYRAKTQPIAESPIKIRLDLEQKLTGRKIDAKKVLNYFENVSNMTGKILMKMLNAGTIDEANQKADDMQFYMAVAEAFRMGNAVYREEELFFEAFNPDLHHRKHVHFDCNMLAEGFMHVAINYGRNLELIIEEEHMFVATPTHEVETTAFRDKKISNETRKNPKGEDVEYTIIEHTDSLAPYFWKEKGWHFANFCRRTGLTETEHNLNMLKKEGKYTPLKGAEIKEVIEASLRGKIISNHLDKKEYEAADRLFDEYIEFAKTVKNPWVAVSGFNILSNKAQNEIDRFKNSKHRAEKAVSSMCKMIDAMEIYAKNHEAVSELARENLRSMELYLEYMKDPNNLDKCLDTLDKNRYTEEGKRQIEVYKKVIKAADEKRMFEGLVESIHDGLNESKGKYNIDTRITVPLCDEYFSYVARNSPGKKEMIYSALDKKMRRIYNESVKRKFPADVLKNLEAIYNGKEFIGSGPVFEAAPETHQMMKDLYELRERVR